MNTQTLRRLMNTQTRVEDAQKGIVSYTASDQSLDSYNEIIMAVGWRFDQFSRNAPFVDSHDYSSIDKLLGRVIEFKVVGRQLVETVQWAIDVPTNLLAIKGFQMTAAGHLKAVSVGFVPVEFVTKFDSDPSGFQSAVKELNLSTTDANAVRCIYTKQQQKELSACILGANPNALARAYSDGILADSDLDRWPEIRRSVEEGGLRARRSFSFPSQHDQTQPTPSMLQSPSFSDYTGRTRAAMANVELARRDGNDSELRQTLRVALASIAREELYSRGDPAMVRLQANPRLRAWFNAFGRAMAGGRLTAEMKECLAGVNPGMFSQRSLIPGPADALGSSLLPIDVSRDVVDLTLTYGAFRSLGVLKATSQFTKFAAVTGIPTAYHLTPARQNVTTVSQDTALSGAALTPETNSVTTLIGISEELLQDEKADLSLVVFQQFGKAFAAAMDYACFQGNGADDTTNGLTTGLFYGNTVASVNAIAAGTNVRSLTRADFLGAVENLTPAALQKNDLHWQIYPGFMAALLTLKDGPSGQHLLKTPLETNGEWSLCGFPVTWNPLAPATDAPSQQIALFGSGQGYLVSMRDEIEVMRSNAQQYQNVLWTVRGIMRARGSLRQANYFTILKTSSL
jgi:HK97 family phage major capsid protein